MKKIIAILLFIIFINLAILASVPTAYANDWPMFHHDLQHTGYSTSDAADTNNVMWTYTTDGDVYSSPAVVDGRVYIGSDDGHVYCLDAEDGDKIWNSSNVGTVWYSSPAISDGRVYIGGDLLYCLNNEDGSRIWSYQGGINIASSPAVVGDRVYIGTWEGNICCLDADPDDNGDGVINHNPYDEIDDDNDEGYDDSILIDYDLIWIYETGDLVISSPAVYADKVYVGSKDKKFYCLYANNGTEIWNYTTQGYVDSSPAIADGKVYFGSDDNKIYCLYADNGTEKWRYSTQGDVKSSPAIANGKVYVGSLDNKVYCLDVTTGLPAWDSPFTTSNDVSSSPAIADGKVYIGSLNKKVYCLDADDGTKLWEYETQGKIDHSSPAIVDGKVYIGSLDNEVYCFGDSQPPETPTQPSGSSTGTANEEYSFTTSTTDPDGDQVYYMWNWGDGTFSDWLGPYNSGETIEAEHTWTEEGDFDVKVKAKDVYGSESGWSQIFTVSITPGIQVPKLTITAPSSSKENENFTVTVTSDEEPIENVNVEFNDDVKTTNSSGQVNFTAPEVDRDTDYTITATLEGYTGDTERITVLNQIGEKGWIYGIVYSDSSPLEDVQITISSGDEKWVKYTTGEGKYVQSLPPGTYTVEASKRGYKTSTEQDIAVTDGVATGLDFVLEKELKTSTEAIDSNIGFIEYTIQKEVLANNIGARLDVDEGEKPETTYYSDELIIELNSTEEVISFTISAEDDTNGTILVIKIGEGVLEDLNNLKITYDGVPVGEFINIEEFFDIQGNITPGWLGFLTRTGLYVFVRIPHFSDHTITISSVISGLVGLIAIIFYIIISTVVFVVFLTPMLANIIRRRMRFR